MSNNFDPSATATELERLQTKGIRVFRTERPENLPVMFFIKPVVDWVEARLIEIMKETFPEARAAFNSVFVHLPADGCRLTELAATAGMSKQAMSEIVDELVDLGYLVRFPDPKDKRAKIILRTEAGLELHQHALSAFSRIERELETKVGIKTLMGLRTSAMQAAKSVQETD